jgi:hypothetical protein
MILDGPCSCSSGWKILIGISVIGGFAFDVYSKICPSVLACHSEFLDDVVEDISNPKDIKIL